MRERCRRLRSFAFVILAVIVGCFALSSTAKANPIPPGKELDFRGGMGGTFSYTVGLGSTASVKNAPIGSVIGFPSFVVSGITDGLLDFTTGPCIATCKEATAHGYASSVPQFAKGGNLMLIGGIPSLGIPDGTILLDGTFVPFTDATGHTHPAVGMSLSANPNISSGVNAYLNVLLINPELLAYYKLSPDFTSGSGQLADLLLRLTFVAPTWNGEIDSTDLLVDPALPEPPSLLLFGSALFLAAYLLRKRVAVGQNS